MIKMFLFTYILIGVVFHMYIEKRMEEVDIKGVVDVMFDDGDPIKDIDLNKPWVHFVFFLIDIICWPYIIFKSNNN